MAWTLMQRLREIEANWDEPYIRTTVGNAADEIERLRAANAELRAEIIESDARAARLAHWLDDAEQAKRKDLVGRLYDLAGTFAGDSTESLICNAAAAELAPIVEGPRCIICGGTDHALVCDSPGALVTGTTGCPVHDAKVRAGG